MDGTRIKRSIDENCSRQQVFPESFRSEVEMFAISVEKLSFISEHLRPKYESSPEQFGNQWSVWLINEPSRFRAFFFSRLKSEREVSTEFPNDALRCVRRLMFACVPTCCLLPWNPKCGLATRRLVHGDKYFHLCSEARTLRTLPLGKPVAWKECRVITSNGSRVSDTSLCGPTNIHPTHDDCTQTSPADRLTGQSSVLV